MDRYPSTMDLDEAAGAPEINYSARSFGASERDQDGTAFELAGNALAPEVRNIPDTKKSTDFFFKRLYLARLRRYSTVTSYQR